MIVLLVAGIGVIVAGLLAVGFGIPVKEFGFGNTLILTGTIGVCTGLLMLSLVVVLRELRAMATGGALGQLPAAPRSRRESQPALSGSNSGAASSDTSAPANVPLFARDQITTDRTAEASPPWQDEVTRDREPLHKTPERAEPEEASEEEALQQKPRRNLMFSSTRRERERAAAEADATKTDRETAPQQRTFEEAWPHSEQKPRLDVPRRPTRSSAPVNDPQPAIPDVTVLKSGVVDGMAYSLYSDGSIEAQMPEGMMRFSSIDELREHLDQRGS
jgi:hypothetical protein